MSKLRIRNGPYSGREKTLAEEPVTIGRDAEATIQILDRSASRFHAEVFPVGGMYFVRDLDSKNGSYINDDMLQDEELLREGDVIKIGTTELIFESGVALNDDDSSDRIAYQDDADLLSNTLEFRIDDLTDIQDEAGDQRSTESRALQILYQVGKILGKASEGEIGPMVLDYLIRAMPAESALIFLRDRRSGRLVPHTVRTSVSRASPVISRTIIRRTVAESRAFFTANAQEDQRLDRKDSAIQKGVRSVLCVPLTMAGQTRGVLYLARGIGAEPFAQSDMELISACAVQLGLAFQGAARQHQQQRTLWSALWAMIRAFELRTRCSGRGERAARAAGALARSLGLSKISVWRLQTAALLYHIDELCDERGQGNGEGVAFLSDIEDFHEVVALIQHAHERLDGSGPLGSQEQDLDTEARVLAVATKFSALSVSDPDADAVQLIERLEGDPGFDDQVVRQLKACHLDGSLQQAVEV